MDIVYAWYDKAQIDYASAYLKLYIAYSAWYQRATGRTSDREALNELKKRFIIWDDYVQGKTMRSLTPYLERLSEYTMREPLTAKTLYWEGYVENVKDWRALIEYWYQVRCAIVHGNEITARYTWYAYETLRIFMEEIITRMQTFFTADDTIQLRRIISTASNTEYSGERIRDIRQKLYRKYITSPNIWEVDMKRVQ